MCVFVCMHVYVYEKNKIIKKIMVSSVEEIKIILLS